MDALLCTPQDRPASRPTHSSRFSLKYFQSLYQMLRGSRVAIICTWRCSVEHSNSTQTEQYGTKMLIAILATVCRKCWQLECWAHYITCRSEDQLNKQESQKVSKSHLSGMPAHNLERVLWYYACNGFPCIQNENIEMRRKIFRTNHNWCLSISLSALILTSNAFSTVYVPLSLVLYHSGRWVCTSQKPSAGEKMTLSL